MGRREQVGGGERLARHIGEGGRGCYLPRLQENIRYTAIELAEQVGVSDNTIHNRMERLEEAGVISRYTTVVGHDRAGLPLSFMSTCTARISKRSAGAEEILAIPEIVEVTELMTGQRNLLVRAVGAEDGNITRVAESVDELDVEINERGGLES